jgi:glycosyltransferase involved in cell wall biosynthesis
MRHATPLEITIATLSREIGQEGVQTHFNELRRFLSRNGKPVHFVNPFDNSPFVVWPVFAVSRLLDPLSGALGVRWYRYFHYVFLKRALARQLNDGRRCVVYAQCPLSAKAAMEARRSPAQKVVLAIHYNVSQADEWILKGKLSADGTTAAGIRALEASVASRVDGLVVFSEFMRRSLIDAAPAAAKVPSLVIAHFVGRIDEPAEEEPKRDLISIGPLEPRKNHQYLLRVLAAAKRLGHAYTLTVIGSGPMRRRLVDLARSLEVAGQVTFEGFRPNAARHILRHRALVHASVVESFGVVLIEAMAGGRPIFAAPVGAIPEVFDDGVEGRYWPLDDPHAAAQILIDVLEVPQDYARISALARAHFEDRFEASHLAPWLVEFLAAVGSGKTAA